jgi:hypothetical protein
VLPESARQSATSAKTPILRNPVVFCFLHLNRFAEHFFAGHQCSWALSYQHPLPYRWYNRLRDKTGFNANFHFMIPVIFCFRNPTNPPHNSLQGITPAELPKFRFFCLAIGSTETRQSRKKELPISVVI